MCFSKQKKQRFSWLLYDFANTIYSMNVVSLYFAPWIVEDLHKEDIWYGIGTSVSMLIVVWTMPFLGECADTKNKKGSMLHLFTIGCVTFTCLLSFGSFLFDSTTTIALAGIIIFILANYAYQGSLVFYNAFLPEITSTENYGKVSGWGVSFGYIGAIVGIILVNPFYDGSIFGMDIPDISGWGRDATFLPSGMLFLLFALPVFFYLRNAPAKNTGAPGNNAIKPASLAFPFVHYIRTARKLKILRFLAAKFFYEEGIETVIIAMAVYVQRVSGFSQSEANLFFVVVIPAAVAGAALCGYIVDKIGAKNTLLVVIGGWIITLVLVIITPNKAFIWAAGSLAGVFLGSTWTAARPLLIALSPPERINECFGLYALSGKAAAIFGPLIWGLVIWALGSYGDIIKYKAAVASLLLFMIIGFLILLGVQSDKKNTENTQ